MTRLTAADYARAEQMLAADGRTPIHGLLWRPHGLDPGRRYPVTEPPTYRLAPLPEPPSGGLLGG